MLTVADDRVLVRTRQPVLYGLAMVRNEADILRLFLAQALALFDKTFIVDIQSTDGTRELLDASVAEHPDCLVVFTCRTQERYQAALMNTLARKAFAEGADWVFPLDSDEFLDVESREALVATLAAQDGDLLFMPWINLIPSDFGDFESFPAHQTFLSPGPSSVNKVAISLQYALVHPDFLIEEGNHNVSATATGRPEPVHPQFPLLHLPIRSAARFKYKMTNAGRLLDDKHNTDTDEGHHVRAILSRLETEPATAEFMRSLALRYGLKDEALAVPAVESTQTVEPPPPSALAQRRLPKYLEVAASRAGRGRSLKETREYDARTEWTTRHFSHDAPVMAEIDGSEIRIRSQPRDALGHVVYDRYGPLAAETPSKPACLDFQLLADAVIASLGEDSDGDARWDDYAPLLYALFSILRPRRYVALGVRGEANFIAACQGSKNLKLGAQCVAVDPWVEYREPMRAREDFDEFRRKIERKFPKAHLLRGSLADAAECFDLGSIDILHVDAYYSLAAGLQDLEGWLPKLSSKGTIVLHNLSTYRRDYGLWRLCEALIAKYPSYTFHYGDGLAVVYVGSEEHVARQAIDFLKSNADYGRFAQFLFARLSDRAFHRIEPVVRLFGPFAALETHASAQGLADPNSLDPELVRIAEMVRSGPMARTLKRALRHALFVTRFKKVLLGLSSDRREHYQKKKRQIKDAISLVNPVASAATGRPMPELSGPSHKDPRHVVFRAELAPRQAIRGLHPSIRLVIPTRGCSKWLPYFLDAYRRWELEPTFAVDHGSEAATLELLAKNHVRTIFIDNDKIPNGESIMPFRSRSIEEDYILRLDDDEFPTRELVDWANSIPDSKYDFVTSWWLPRYEVAMLDGRLQSCHPKWLRTRVGEVILENLHGGRFYRHKDVTYDQVGPHHGNFISDYVSHAPREALLIHLDYLVRTMEERIGKIRSTEKRFPDAGWPFANHMLPEMAPRNLLRPREFDDPNLAPLVEALLANVYRPTEKLTLSVDELMAIQRDRLDHDTMHFHY